jgi:hypothetical protein
VTELLRKAVPTLSELPPEKQDALATMVLEEIACEQGSIAASKSNPNPTS